MTRYAILVSAITFLLAASLHARPGEPKYTPREGDLGVVVIRTITPGQMEKAGDILRAQLISRLKTDDFRMDTWMMCEDGGSEIIGIGINEAALSFRTPHLKPVDELLTGFLAKPTRVIPVKVLLQHCEGFTPQVGDKVGVFWRKVKPGKMAEAESIYRKEVLPAVQQDGFKRHYLVLADEQANLILGVSFLRGEVVSAPEVIRKRAALDALMTEPARQAVYTVFSLNDE